MSRREYVAVQVQIEGNLESWSHVYYSDQRRHRTRDAAIRWGIRVLDHDDFLIGVLEGDTLVMTAWQHEDRPDEADERDAMAEQLGWKA